MPDPLEDLLRACTVRVLGPRPGAGFFIAPGVVLTCAHVVGAVTDLEINWDAGDGQNHPARVLTTVGDRGRPIPSLDSDYPDLALLRVEGLDDHACVAVDQDWPRQDDRFQVYGYPEEGGSVLLTPAMLSYRGEKGSEPAVFLDLASDKVKRGMSGAAVLNLRSGAVCGLVVASKDVAAPDGALVVTWASMGEVVADHLTANRLFHQADHRWREADALRPTTPHPAFQRSAGDRVSAAVETWRDRDQIRHDLRAALLKRTRIISVVGRRGIGKSAVVARVLADFEQADPARSPLEDLDGLAYLSTRTGAGGLTLAQIYEQIARLAAPNVADRLRIRWENAGADALPALWEDLRDRSLVVVLDNIDDLQDEAGRLVASDIVRFLTSVCLTPYPPRVVTTSQRPLNVDWEIESHIKILPLDEGLPSADAVWLLRQMDTNGWLLPIPDATLSAAAEKLHFVPRGLELLGNRAKRDPSVIDDLVRSESAPSELLLELVSLNFSALAPDGRAVLSLLALAGVPLPVDDIPIMLNDLEPADDIARAVRSLVSDRHIGLDAQRAVRLHPLDADYLSQKLRADDPTMQVRLELSLADWYASRRRPPAAWRVLEDATPSQREFRHRWSAGDYDRALAVLAEAANFLARKGEGGALRNAIKAAGAVVAGAQAKVDLEYCRFCAEFFDGSLENAEAALRAARAAADAVHLRSRVVALDIDLATVLRHRGDPDGSLAILRPLIASPGDLDHQCWVDALFEAGLACCYVGDLAGARDAAALLAATPISAPEAGYVNARTGDLLALAALIDGDAPAALAAADDAIANYLDTPNQDNVGYLWNVRGLVHLQQNDLADAETELRRGLDTAVEFRIDRLEGICATNLAWCLLLAGRWDEAGAAAARGVQRLAQNSVSAQVVGAELSLLVAAIDDPALDVTSSLARAAAGGDHNPDIYRPSDDVLAGIAAALRRRRQPPDVT